MSELLPSWVLIERIQGTSKSPELEHYIDRFLQGWKNHKGINNLIYRLNLHAILDNIHNEKKLLKDFKRLFNEA
jgi:hypothetical protein